MTLLEIQHAQMVQQLFKPAGEILSSLTPARCGLLHAAVGISGEAGELRKRYPNGYTNSAAQERADKQPETRP